MSYNSKNQPIFQSIKSSKCQCQTPHAVDQQISIDSGDEYVIAQTIQPNHGRPLSDGTSLVSQLIQVANSNIHQTSFNHNTVVFCDTTHAYPYPKHLDSLLNDLQAIRLLAYPRTQTSKSTKSSSSGDGDSIGAYADQATSDQEPRHRRTVSFWNAQSSDPLDAGPEISGRESRLNRSSSSGNLMQPDKPTRCRSVSLRGSQPSNPNTRQTASEKRKPRRCALRSSNSESGHAISTSKDPHPHPHPQLSNPDAQADADQTDSARAPPEKSKSKPRNSKPSEHCSDTTTSQLTRVCVSMLSSRRSTRSSESSTSQVTTTSGTPEVRRSSRNRYTDTDRATSSSQKSQSGEPAGQTLRTPSENPTLRRSPRIRGLQAKSSSSPDAVAHS